MSYQVNFVSLCKQPLYAYIGHFLISANLPIVFMNKVLTLILSKLKTNSLDRIATNILVSRFLLDQSKMFDSETTALPFSRFIKLYLREKCKRDTC